MSSAKALTCIMPEKERDKKTRNIIVNMKNNLMGFIIHTDSEAPSIMEKDIDDSPDFDLSSGADFIPGMEK